MSYLSLDPERIIETTQVLRSRIEERFPGAGLGKVCGELHAVALRAAERSRAMARTSPLILAAVAVLAIGLLGAVVTLAVFLPARLGSGSAAEYIQGVEALFEIVVLLGAAIAFLVTLGRRRKRHRALDAIHELRSLAHVVDMHQLTKDPERLARGADQATPSSPKVGLTSYEMARYFDYCSEMLSLIAKVAALYVQGFQDPVVLDAVDDVEDLTSGLARKIWQKIMILDRLIHPGDGGDSRP